MSDFFTQFGDKSVQNIDKRRMFVKKERAWLMVLLKVIGVLGAVAVAVAGSQWLPQIWHQVKGLFH